MFGKIIHTAFPPQDKPVLIWDGECGFCKYWIMRWKKITADKVNYRTFQEAADDFKDFPLKEFKKASRLIETNGSIYSGPDSAYRAYEYSSKHNYKFHQWYVESSFFRKISDHGYNWIAKNRSFMFTLTQAMFGKNPLSLKPYWLIYILILICLPFIAIKIF